MSFFTTPAIQAGFQAQPDVKVQVGSGIARYGLFSFLDSIRLDSNLLQYVQSALPPDIKLAVDAAIKSSADLKKKRLKKRALLQSLPAYLQAIINQLINPLANSNAIDGGLLNWGSATIRTDGLKGDIAWATYIFIGTQMQPLRINIDSGSSDLFLFDPTCQKCSLSNHSPYRYQLSRSFTPFFSNNFTASYADDSSVSGYLAQDLVTIGGLVKISKQTFGMAREVSPIWSSLAIDGVMGIGPDSLTFFDAPSGKTGVFSTLVRNGALASPVIGIALVKASGPLGAAGAGSGQFSFGTIGQQWIKQPVPQVLQSNAAGPGGLAWRKVSSHNFWGIELSGIYVNGINSMGPKDPPRVILDTGTSITLVSEITAARIHAQIPGAKVDSQNGIWRVPCDVTKAPAADLSNTASILRSLMKSSSTLSSVILSTPVLRKLLDSASITSKTPQSTPNVFFEFGEGKERFGIPASDLAFQKIDPADLSDPEFKDDHQPYCYSAIQPGTSEFVVLGDTFIKNHYIALRYDTDGGKSVGIGNRTDVLSMT